MGTLTSAPVTTAKSFDARYTNLGAATGGLCFHTLVNGMWLSSNAWMPGAPRAAVGRSKISSKRLPPARRFPGVIDVDAEPLLLDSNMPERINHELWRLRLDPIPDLPGNEPVFARLIFESLAARYASAIASLEQMLGRKLERIHILGGASRNKLLTELTAQRTGLPVETGQPESSTIGNFAIQLAASEASGKPLSPEAVRQWAARLCKS